MTITNIPDLCSDIADHIAVRIGGRVARSSQSASYYVSAQIDDEREFVVRVSDHEARSYNRAGDYAIHVGETMDGDCHALVRAEWAREEFEMDAGDGETIVDARDVFRFDSAAAAEAVEMAVAAFARARDAAR